MPPPPATPRWREIPWALVSNWASAERAGTIEALKQSCKVMAKQAAWSAICQAASAEDAGASPAWWTARFSIFEINPPSESAGVLTGYYEPALPASRQRSERYRWPIYGVPKDLLTLDLAAQYPALANQRVRGRLDGATVRPYFTRAEIDAGKLPRDTPVLAWASDPVDVFFLQIQGSGRLQLQEGGELRVGYADHNGHPYQSIGKELIRRGELTLPQASMQGIQTWVRQHPAAWQALAAVNPSYVFFRELPGGDAGPVGSQGVSLTAGYSLAVDVRSVPLGAPVLFAAEAAGKQAEINRLAIAQDTGGAILGAIRADLYVGSGAAAGEQAGRLKQALRYWLLWPQGEPLPPTLTNAP